MYFYTFKVIFHLQLLQNIDCIYLEPWACLTPGICPSHSPLYSIPPPPSLVIISLFSMCVLFCYIQCFVYFLCSMFKWYHIAFVFLIWHFTSCNVLSYIHVGVNVKDYFLWLNNIPPHLLYLFIHWWILRFFPCVQLL